jgi:phage-related protein
LLERNNGTEQARIGVVHGFIKKTQKAPKAEIALGLTRMKEMNK